jgi:hypothetical protein
MDANRALTVSITMNTLRFESAALKCEEEDSQFERMWEAIMSDTKLASGQTNRFAFNVIIILLS